jgi:hypothetical protein
MRIRLVHTVEPFSTRCKTLALSASLMMYPDDIN